MCTNIITAAAMNIHFVLYSFWLTISSFSMWLVLCTREFRNCNLYCLFMSLSLSLCLSFFFYFIACDWLCASYFQCSICSCKEYQNLNAFFAVVMGLSNNACSRLTQSWDKVPSKFKKLFMEFEALIDPSRNHRAYR